MRPQAPSVSLNLFEEVLGLFKRISLGTCAEHMKNPGQFLQCFAEGVLGQGPEKDGRRSLVYKALVSLQKMKATGPENGCNYSTSQTHAFAF